MSATLPVSVVVPSYNHGDFIEECLDSALATRVEIEVVVVDDGSTDDTRERIEPFLSDPRMRFYPQHNRGAHAAFNRGVGLARGELIFLLNSDDAFAPARIETLCERFARQPELAVLSSWLEVVDRGGDRLGIKEAWHNMPPWPRPAPGPGLAGPGLADGGEPLLALLETNFISTTSNVAFRRRLVAEQALSFRPLRYAHDWDFILAAAAGGDLGVVEEPLVRYRVHPSNTLREGRDEGKGPMRFEILWVVARHALRVCRRFVRPGLTWDDLRARLWRSLPRFGCETILQQLLLLRGEDDAVPPAYDALLDKHHPFRRRAVDVLGLTEDG